ncbi:CvpA family protein [Odoribacter laneus]|uniref:CvpA family protein n=1 Tax=Odoribacter laneus TaxID=626933 RepID=UPI003AB4A795
MNYIDIILLLPLLYGAYRGFSRGLIIEVATLLGLLLGVYIAIKFSGYTEDFLRDFLNLSSESLSYVALGVTFLIVVVAISLLGKMLTKLIDIISLGMVNKLLGTVLGIAKYFVFLCIAFFIVEALDGKFHFINEEVKEKSLLYNAFLTFAQRMYNMIKF